MFNSISVESVTSWLDRVLRVTFSPWYVTSNSMVELLNASNEERAKTDVKTVQDRLTTWWVERKLAELAFVGVTCALVAGVVAAAFSWRELDKIAWGTKGLWYGSLVMDLTSICLATQQTLALHRLCCHDSKLEIIRQMLCKPTTNGAAKAEPRWTQLFLWQSAIMLLNIGIVLFLIGLVIQIITDLSEVYSPENKKAFVLFAISAIFSASVYLSSSVMLYRASKMPPIYGNRPARSNT